MENIRLGHEHFYKGRTINILADRRDDDKWKGQYVIAPGGETGIADGLDTEEDAKATALHHAKLRIDNSN